MGHEIPAYTLVKSVLPSKCIETGREIEAAAHPDLAGYRATRGLSLDEIANSTKITVRYLQAIERGEWRKLPGGLYNISYIRQYARATGCDEGPILDRYFRAVGD